MSAKLHLLAATAASVPVLAELHRACFDPAWDRAAIAKTLAMPGSFAFIALRGADNDNRLAAGEAGEPVGLVIARLAAGEAEILTIGTRPEHRAHGVGRALMRAVIEAARQSGAEYLFLEVATDNPPALHLYESLGFETVGLRPGYYERPGGPVGAKTMKLAL